MKLGDPHTSFLAPVNNYSSPSRMTIMSQLYTDGKEGPNSTSTLTQSQLVSEALEKKVDLHCTSAMTFTEVRATVWRLTPTSRFQKIEILKYIMLRYGQ